MREAGSVSGAACMAMVVRREDPAKMSLQMARPLRAVSTRAAAATPGQRDDAVPPSPALHEAGRRGGAPSARRDGGAKQPIEVCASRPPRHDEKTPFFVEQRPAFAHTRRTAGTAIGTRGAHRRQHRLQAVLNVGTAGRQERQQQLRSRIRATTAPSAASGAIRAGCIGAAGNEELQPPRGRRSSPWGDDHCACAGRPADQDGDNYFQVCSYCGFPFFILFF